MSRNGVDHAKRFHDVTAAIAALPVPTLVLDGEVAIFDRKLRSRFDGAATEETGRSGDAFSLHD
jgi:ATP-dependent DNA ligase